MRKCIKKLLMCGLIAVLLMLSESVFAEGANDIVANTDVVETDKESIIAKGSTGDSLEWVLTDDGTLTISGEGAMPDYEFDYDYYEPCVPWLSYRSKIQTVVIEDGITHIGEYAFFEHQKMTKVVIGEAVESIGMFAFSHSNYVTKFTVGNNITFVGTNAFNGWVALEETYISDLSAWCGFCESMPHGGCLYLNGDKVTDVIIPENVTEIGNICFYAYDDILSVTIPESVISIGKLAFCCPDLKDIYFEGDVSDWVRITRRGETYTTSANLHIDGSLVTDVTVPEGVTEISDYAFYKCGTLTSISLPDTLTNIGTSAFEGCNNLLEINLSTNIISIGTKALKDCCNLASIYIPEGLNEIGEYAFQGCTGLNQVEIPDSVMSIGIYAFKECTGLKTIAISSKVVEISEGMLYRCIGLQEVVIPSEVVEINAHAFEQCTGLTKTSIESKLLNIAENAFDNCTNLSEINIPNTVTNIGENAFYNCINMSDVSLPTNLKTIGDAAFKNCKKIRDLTFSEYMENTGNNTFQNCTGLKNVNLSVGISTIGNYAFSGCTGIETMNIPSNVANIRNYAFENCGNLHTISFEGDAPLIEDKAFNNVSATCHYPANNKTYTNEIITVEYGGDLVWTYEGKTMEHQCGDAATWELTADGVLYIKGTGAMYDYSLDDLAYAPWYDDRGSITSIVIEEGITHIGDIAFYDCTNVQNVTIPDTIVSIGVRAFQRIGATQVQLSDNVREIKDRAFAGSCIKSIILPDSVTIVGEGIFASSDLESIILNDGLTYISDNMFSGSYYLTDVDLPECVETIGDYAFSKCYGLESMILPEGLISIGEYAFQACGASDLYGSYYDSNNFTSITLPNSLENIGEGAFWYCQSLQEITIPQKVTVLENYVLGYCYRLSNVSISENIEQVGMQAFVGCKRLTSITYRWGAPEMSDTMCNLQVNATCYYPSNNSEWTTDLLKNYGGNLTWVAMEMEEPENSIGGGDTGNPGDEGEDSGESGGDGDTSIEDGDTEGGNEAGDSDSSTEGKNPSEEGGSESGDGSDSEDESGNTGGEGTGGEGTGSGSDGSGDYTFMIRVNPENQVVEIGNNAVFSVEAEGAELTYQWQYSNNNGTYWYNSGMTGCTTNELTVKATLKRNGQMYRCIIMDAYGNQLVSEIVTLTIAEPEIAVSIIKQPENQVTAIGSNAVFTVEAVGSELIYQWQFSKSAGKYWTNSGMDGANTNCLIVPVIATRAGQMYRCIITDTSGNSVTSDVATLTIENTKKELVITKQPENCVAKEGEDVVFTVDATGDGLCYQWQYSSNNGKYWFDSGMDGADTSVLTVNALAKRAGQMYRCVITDANGEKITSEAGTLIIDDSKSELTIITQPQNQRVELGTDAIFTIEVEGEDLTYQWQYSSSNGKYWFDSGMNGADTNCLTVEALAKRNGQQYRCVVTDKEGNKVTSEIAILEIN